MIVTGIIKEIEVGVKSNKYKLEIQRFKMPGDSTANNYTFEANASVPGNISHPYEINDKVYVGFFNNTYSYPIILGKIYEGNDNECRASSYLDTLKVKSKVELPQDTKINDISYKDLSKALIDIKQLENAKNKQNYSTAEQVCGTWIDGEDIYRIAGETEITKIQEDTAFLQLSSANDVISINFSIQLSNGNIIGQQNYFNSSSTIQWLFVYWNKETKYLTYHNVGYLTGCKLRYVVEYTKATTE